jgi:hypothetical protein
MTDTERTQRDIYGDDTIDDGLQAVRTHNQRVAHHRAQHEDDDEEEEGEAMDLDLAYDEEALAEVSESLMQRLDELGTMPHVRKSLTRLTDEVFGQQCTTRRLHGDIADLQKSLRTAYRHEHANRAAIGALATAVDRLCKGLMRLGQEKPSPLVKSVSTFVQPGDSLAKAKRVTAWVVKSFGPRGGQQIAYDRELCAKLRLTKSLTPDEEARWKDFGRLPDRIDVRNPQPQPAAQAERNNSIMAQHVLAGLGLSPLVFPALARRS